jgi:hypothetical protein
MKALAVIILMIILYSCLAGGCTNGRFILKKYDPQLAHKCQMDPYKPECSVN